MSQPPARKVAKRTPATATAAPGSQRIPGEFLAPPPQELPDIEAKIPLWQQIADDLRARIESGQLPPGQLIPSESDLTQRYGASRPTARQALAHLRTAGLVITERGRGTRVRPSPSSAHAVPLRFNPTVIQDSRGSTFTTWDSTEWTNVREPSLYRTSLGRYGDLLKLSPGEPVFIYERQLVHTTGAQIVHRAYVPFALAAIVPSLATDPALTPELLYQVLTDAGFTLHWNDIVHAEMPAPDDVAALVIPPGVPMLVHTRVTVAADDRPLILEETRLPADRAAVMTRSVQ